MMRFALWAEGVSYVLLLGFRGKVLGSVHGMLTLWLILVLLGQDWPWQRKVRLFLWTLVPLAVFSKRIHGPLS